MGNVVVGDILRVVAEWNIPDGAIITVPFPLMQSLEDYKTNLDQYFLYYGR